MRRIILLIVLSVCFASIGLACKEQYALTENITIIDAIEFNGQGASCNITIYNTTAQVQQGEMTANGLQYTYYANVLPEGTYTGAITCYKNVTNYYVGECKFKVYEDNRMVIAIIILLPLILGLFLVIGASSMGESHPLLRIFLFLMSFISFIASMHIGLISVVKFFDFPELEALIGSTTYWAVITFGLLIAYFSIYGIYVMVRAAAERKESFEY